MSRLNASNRKGYTPPKGLRGLLDFYDLLSLQHGLRARGVSLSGNNRYVPHQGPRERARRVRQGLTP
jgi:hypothetical protein